MPGVTITTAVRTGATNTGIAPAATFFIAGTTERGIDTEAVLVTSLEDFETKFGSHVSGSYTWYSLRTFFEEGGVRAYVARATASDGVAGSKALLVGTSDPGITLTAVGKGAWGNSLSVTATNNTTNFDLSVTYNGTTVFSGVGYLSLTEAINAINFDITAQYYFTAALTASASASALLKTAAASAFTSGANGAIAKSDYIADLALFTADLGSGSVAAPGVATGTSDDALYDALRTHAQANNRIAICSMAEGASLSSARSASTGYTGTEYHEYMAFYHPWVKIPNGTVTVNIPPDAYVAGVRSRTHNQAGPWKAYAGVVSEAEFVSDTVLAVSRSEGDLMDAARLNPIRVINGRVRIYGARSHSSVTAQWRFITARDTINYIVTEAEKRLEDLVFSTIDGRSTLYANIINAAQGVLEPIRINGGLYEGFTADGRRIDYGYTIKCDSTLNPLSQLEEGTVRARIGVRVSSVGDKIDVDLIKSNLTTALA
jgi:phage tail sheath protein FI